MHLSFDIVYNATVFNWRAILSTDLKSAIIATKIEERANQSNFFMASYLMDALCA